MQSPALWQARALASFTSALLRFSPPPRAPLQQPKALNPLRAPRPPPSACPAAAGPAAGRGRRCAAAAAARAGSPACATRRVCGLSARARRWGAWSGRARRAGMRGRRWWSARAMPPPPRRSSAVRPHDRPLVMLETVSHRDLRQCCLRYCLLRCCLWLCRLTSSHLQRSMFSLLCSKALCAHDRRCQSARLPPPTVSSLCSIYCCETPARASLMEMVPLHMQTNG